MNEINETKAAIDDIEATIFRINQLTCNFDSGQQTKLSKLEKRLNGLVWYVLFVSIIVGFAFFSLWEYHREQVQLLESMILTVQEQNAQLIEFQTRLTTPIS